MTYEYLKENNLIIYECIVGSQSYGTNTPTSDIDKKFVYLQPLDDILGTGYCEQITVDKDHVGFELRRFIELLAVNNPSVLELLNTPEDCILHKHPVFDKILQAKDTFITKKCYNAFAGYSRSQISKASGLNKLQNWEQEKVVRKDILDFCYTLDNYYGSKPWKQFAEVNLIDGKFCGLVKVPHMRDMYYVYYDQIAESCFSEKYSEDTRAVNKVKAIETFGCYGLGYKGFVKEDGNESNELRLSEIPKGEKPICVVSFNKDAYSIHCKEYRQYQTWLENRNERRYVEVNGHGQKIDGHKMMHFVRLVTMAKEIGLGLGVNVRRNDAEYLLDIRRGKYNLQELYDLADAQLRDLKTIFENSTLPDDVPDGFVDGLIVSIRREIYGLNKSFSDER